MVSHKEMMSTHERERRWHGGKRPRLTVTITQPQILPPTFTETLIERAISAAENIGSIPVFTDIASLIVSDQITSPQATCSEPADAAAAAADVSDPVFDIINDSGRLMQLVDEFAELHADSEEYLDSKDKGKLARESQDLKTAISALERVVAGRKGAGGGAGKWR
ncbi:hypothetical protein L873DRAFT_1818509 [Choiromyces venosus 120613-1]|uniref:Uncharacterized protein n=1 Tax=Choiromyces venosus 120613-1 TaxID=1336337 RepID=A0A3N4JDM3_9PEZI|nr:hypothetical protein L873DRAFT_1818509 [Choiromyces venosus 120613-1]